MKKTSVVEDTPCPAFIELHFFKKAYSTMYLRGTYHEEIHSSWKYLSLELAALYIIQESRAILNRLSINFYRRWFASNKEDLLLSWRKVNLISPIQAYHWEEKNMELTELIGRSTTYDYDRLIDWSKCRISSDQDFHNDLLRASICPSEVWPFNSFWTSFIIWIKQIDDDHPATVLRYLTRLTGLLNRIL